MAFDAEKSKIEPEVREVLLRAAELVEKGWIQYCLAQDAKGCAEWQVSDEFEPVSFCIVGACIYAGDGGPAIKALTNNLGITQYELVNWNNAPNRLQSEVVELLRTTAAS